MKILAFVDVHGNRSAIKRLIEASKEVDLIICAGDLTVFENDAEELLESLAEFKQTVYMIPGNHESAELLGKLKSKFPYVFDLHRKVLSLPDIELVGYGQGGFSLVDKDFERFTHNYARQNKNRLVLVTHAPPYNTKLDELGHEHHGNKSLREFIERHKPELVICGHFHENHGKSDHIGATIVVNPGPNGMIIEL